MDRGITRMTTAGYFSENQKYLRFKKECRYESKLVYFLRATIRANYSERVGRKVSDLQPLGQGSGIAESLHTAFCLP